MLVYGFGVTTLDTLHPEYEYKYIRQKLKKTSPQEMTLFILRVLLYLRINLQDSPKTSVW